MAAAHELYYIISCAATPNAGAQVRLDWKAWFHDGTARWDLQRVTSVLSSTSGTSQQLHRWWKEKLKSLKGLWEVLPVPAPAYIPSKRSQDATSLHHGQNRGYQDASHEVGTLSTRALLVFLEVTASTSRRRLLREVATSLLDQFFCAALPGSVLQDVDWRAVPEDVMSECWMSDAMGQCHHLDICLGGLDDKEKSPQQRLRIAFSALMQQSVQCDACSSWARHFLELRGGIVYDIVPQVAYTTDPTKSERPRDIRGHRVQEDEDYKRYVTSNVIRDRRAVSAGTFLRAEGHTDGRLGHKWCHKELSRYQTAAWLNAACATSVALAVDATRLGNPGEDTLALASWVQVPGKQFGAVLPPQVMPA